ncbi:hypothetical protein K470DRAFT_254752 [Piedraia hortae CBS 480.64]|uniref:Endoplasmic reticulum junction formation protein lunapark n=1 Tax=Piedraia hortae CBS 480.64 TaxID=1314780 RepID=A0A6A7C8H7_9PEZI|nr:hypothetical protein K470DRAFT_254752 [Piedraia hortae CBS 480.64]
MVSFWPFKGDDDSAASFERALSKLAGQISKVDAQNDSLRRNQRRFKLLWTLYSAFAYIIVAAILTLITGYQQWNAMEYTAMAGGPVLIIVVRMVLNSYYNFRVSSTQSQLDELRKQREATIKKLKEATRYDTTQQLLDKYGETPRKAQTLPRPQRNKNKAEEDRMMPNDRMMPVPPQLAMPQRTGFVPPPTANIQASRPVSARAADPPSQVSALRLRRSTESDNTRSSPLGPGEEFAPNAFTEQPQRLEPFQQPANSGVGQQVSEGPKWYDRILDVILGEDETQAKNRIALICQHCKLVNGLAPPGATTPEDIGRWRCSNCHEWNGVESESTKILNKLSAGEPLSPARRPISEASNEEHEGEDVKKAS